MSNVPQSLLAACSCRRVGGRLIALGVVGFLIALPSVAAVPNPSSGHVELEASAHLRDLALREEPVGQEELVDALRGTSLSYVMSDGESEALQLLSILLLYRRGELVARVEGEEPIVLEAGQRASRSEKWVPGGSVVSSLLSELERAELFLQEVFSPTETGLRNRSWSPSAAAVGLESAPGGLVLAVIHAGDGDLTGRVSMRPLTISFTGLD